MPDGEASNCVQCSKKFGTAEELVSSSKQSPSRSNSQSTSVEIPESSSGAPPICDRRRHHCRSCGQAVCNNCSLGRKPVPERGKYLNFE